MKIVFAAAYYPPYTIGGAEESTLALARALRNRGHDVRVVAPRLGPDLPDGDVPIGTVPVGLALEEPGRALRPAVFDRPTTQWRLMRGLERGAADADVMHCHSLPVLPAAYAAARRLRIPIVATIRDLGGVCPVSVCLLSQSRVPHDCGLIKLERTCVPEFLGVYGGSRFRLHLAAPVRYVTSRLRSKLLNRCDAVCTVGQDLGPLYVEAGLVDPQKLALLPNIAELPGGNGRHDGAYAVYAGKISPGKGVDVLLEAAKLVRAREPEFRLAVAGYADERWRTRLEREPGIEYHGRIERRRLARLYAGARFAVVPSVWPEPFPRAVLEPAALGVPVVATRAGGIPDAIEHGQTGLLVEPRDAPALAEAMTELWRDPARARVLGLAARRLAETRFSADTIGRRAESIYATVLGPRPH